MENEFEEGNIEERIKSLGAIFRSPGFKLQIQQWNEEKQENRALFRGYWDRQKEQFEKFIQSEIAEEETKIAMVVTALEDIPNSLEGAFMSIVCPELMDLQENVLQMTDFSKLIEIFKYIVEERENDHNIFDRSFIVKSVEFEEKEKNFENGSLVVHSLLLVRSCILLQFALAFWLIFDNTQNTTE